MNGDDINSPQSNSELNLTTEPDMNLENTESGSGSESEILELSEELKDQEEDKLTLSEED